MNIPSVMLAERTAMLSARSHASLTACFNMARSEGANALAYSRGFVPFKQHDNTFLQVPVNSGDNSKSDEKDPDQSQNCWDNGHPDTNR